MRNKKKAIFITCFVLLLVIFFVSCTSTTPSSTTTSSEIATTITSSIPITGVVQGRLLDSETKKPLEGAAIILGLVTGDSECTLDADLIASTDQGGNFQLLDVHTGTYVIFYYHFGIGIDTWKKIDGRQIKYGLIGKPLWSANSLVTEEIKETLGGNGTLVTHFAPGFEAKIGWDSTLQKEIIMSTLGRFAITSIKYYLTLQFEYGEFLTLEVIAGETTSIDILVIATSFSV